MPDFFNQTLPQFEVCKEQEYTAHAVLEVACAAGFDLQRASTTDLGYLATVLKQNLSEACDDFKPCGYKLGDGFDVTTLDARSLQFSLQGPLVRRLSDVMLACHTKNLRW